MSGSVGTGPVEYLEVDDLLAAGRALLEKEPVVRDWGALDSAVHRPQSSMFGVEAYPTLDTKAAALMLSVVQNHALVDGNKRLGVVAVVVFYGLNGRRFVAPHEELFSLTMAIADGSLGDVATVAATIAPWAR
ncbi:type II toxin-antitoxin system death-on-curing family toxin [Luteimicrobium xylanilyticum]|uniref:Toxin Doc n=1 Tax=Luteimicrobium xylanilyticum TaxID=1133546 RepID=A0A5P9QAQ2_9MICO|nr:type II toxin-antitoxin system death-on-curing family toxin [Luteimicrobium xylanilyticum]QFU98439.1 Toxin Doc [Luteimicrobium xylanilyticum]